MNKMADFPMLRGLPAQAPEVHLTELEARLAEAGGAALKQALLERLAGTESRLRREMAGLQPPEDFVLRSLLADATLAALQCLGSWAVRAAQEPLSGPGLPTPASTASHASSRSQDHGN